MAYTVINTSSRVIHSFGDIEADMPTNGVGTAAMAPCSILIASGVAATVVIEVTFDSPTAIAAGSAVWVAIQSETVSTTQGAKVDMWVAPTAIKLTTATGGVAAWILT